MSSSIVVVGVTSPYMAMPVALNGQRSAHPYVAAVNTIEYPVETFRRLVRGADLAVLTNTAFARPLLGRAHEEGVPIAVDVHLITDVDDAYNRPWLEVAGEYAQEAAARLLRIVDKERVLVSRRRERAGCGLAVRLRGRSKWIALPSELRGRPALR